MPLPDDDLKRLASLLCNAEFEIENQETNMDWYRWVKKVEEIFPLARAAIERLEAAEKMISDTDPCECYGANCIHEQNHAAWRKAAGK